MCKMGAPWVYTLENFVSYDREKLAARLHADLSEADTAAEFDDFLRQAAAVTLPKLMLTKMPVEHVDESHVRLNGVLFQSKLLTENLREAAHVYGMVATCGTEIAEWAEQIDDPLLRYYADEVMIETVGIAAAFAVKKVAALEAADVDFVRNTSPGSCVDWPIFNQEGLFQAIGDVTGRISVVLSDSYLMLPLKSVSGVYYISPHSYTDCMYCSRTNCPNRRAEQIPLEI